MEKITIQTAIPSDLKTVWEAYTSPEHIVNWNFASDDWCCPEAKNDLKEGGTYFARMEAKDGSFGFDFKAIYSHVDPQSSLTYKLEDGRDVKTSFERDSQGVIVTTVFDPESQNPIDMQRDGWQAILNQFKSYVTSLKG
ncbi:SRPBCC family protein [Mangrovimonas sp. AS39]|uniref:SRPBCC family protein n=1 Tax=Mangrovimonas futianensis TaxID=2895523 RepID=UPI001E423EAD|nr:SRPBCC family protein [Mangrovimonas futianensis]MCF1193036.1 SRPBCC family protein [Mangrovimonas futianensis]MCF1196727.1 SRPBCC family protein [Mangrovimonas futianensis]